MTQARHKVSVTFGDHITLDQVGGMYSGLAACGDVTKESDRHFIVETYRDAKLEYLKKELAGWEQWGFVRWEQLS